jgi:hypothetical protein
MRYMGIGDRALVVLPDSGSCAGWLIEDLTHELSEMDALLGGVNCILVFFLACGLGDASVVFGLVVDGSSAEYKQISRSRLAHIVVICPVCTLEACKLEVVAAPPPQRQAHADRPLEVA